MENKQAHLGMIQGVVNRLSHNSFLLKGWSVVMVSAMFALAAKGSQLQFVYLAYFPAIIFWGLDGYFLHQEKLFRALYNHVRELEDEKIDYAMDTSIVEKQVFSWGRVTLSKTLFIFHGVIVFSIIVVTTISIFCNR